MDGYLGRVADHLLVGVDVGGPEVYQDVHNEHDIHHQVHHVERRAGVAALPPPPLLDVVEEEGRGVGGENGGVDDQEQDEPVPYRFEGAVMEDGPFVYPWSLEFVFRQHVGAERKNLGRERRRLKTIYQTLAGRCLLEIQRRLTSKDHFKDVLVKGYLRTKGL